MKPINFQHRQKNMELSWLLGVMLGISLSACCGFRVFVPLLAANVAALSGFLPLADSFAWLNSWAAFACLATATVAEITAYYFPFIDNLLDSIAAPASVIAGTLVSASVLPTNDPLWSWGLGLLLGGGSAATVQTGTTALRLLSSKFTVGTGNVVVASTENTAAVGGSIAALFMPLLTGICFIVFILVLLLWGVNKVRAARKSEDKKI
jgi:hypothetical protein